MELKLHLNIENRAQMAPGDSNNSTTCTGGQDLQFDCEHTKTSLQVSDKSAGEYSFSGAKIADTPKTEGRKIRDATFEDIAPFLPKGKFSSDAKQIKKCRFDGCVSVSSAETYGYCPTHFTQLYNEGVINLPFHKGPGVQQQSKTPESVPGVHDNKPKKSHKRREQTQRVNRDIIESAESEEEDYRQNNHSANPRKSKTKCVHKLCKNEADKSCNGLCRECYNLLTQLRLQGVPPPEPTRTTSKLTADTRNSCYHHSELCYSHQCGYNHNRRTGSCCHDGGFQGCQYRGCHGRCRLCGAHIEGGCYCVSCSCCSKDHTERDASKQFCKHHVLDSPAAAHRNLIHSRHQDYEGRRGDDRTRVTDYDNEYSSLQATDCDSSEYTVSIGDSDYVRPYANFDRG